MSYPVSGLTHKSPRIRIEGYTACSCCIHSWLTNYMSVTEIGTQPMTNMVVKSEPGFSPSIDAEIVGSGNDYIHNDPSGKHMRLDAHGVVK